MSQVEEPLAADRKLRDEARLVMNNRYARLKTGLAAKGLGERAAEAVKGKAKAVVKETVEVANDSRGIIAVTVTALACWTWRKPILAELGKLPPQLRDIRDKLITRFSKE